MTLLMNSLWKGKKSKYKSEIVENYGNENSKSIKIKYQHSSHSMKPIRYLILAELSIGSGNNVNIGSGI